MIMSDKVEGFRVSDEMSKELKKQLFQTGQTKKDFLSEKVDAEKFLEKTRNKAGEKWTLVPNSELEHLHSGYPDHFDFIHQRILEHCIQQDLEITFDNLLLDCLYFYNFNNMKYFRYQDEDIEVLVIEHNVGISYSNFTEKLLKKFLAITTQYNFVSSQPSESKIIFKFQKC